MGLKYKFPAKSRNAVVPYLEKSHLLFRRIDPVTKMMGRIK
jgi:hypothetical protein